jgi:hypothetical protein
MRTVFSIGAKKVRNAGPTEAKPLEDFCELKTKMVRTADPTKL